MFALPGRLSMIYSPGDKLIVNWSYLSLFCPGLSVLQVLKESRNKIKLFRLGWNMDDEKIPYKMSKDFLHQLYFYRIEHRFYSYPEGGHEIQPKFLFELK